MTVLPRTIQIRYGGWDSDDLGWSVDGAHTARETRDEFVLTFVAIQVADDPAVLDTRIGLFKAALEIPNELVEVTYSGQPIFGRYDPSVGVRSAQSTEAAWEPIEEPRSDRVRAYRVTITGRKPATAVPTRQGRRSTVFDVVSTPEGIRTVRATIEYTPLPGTGSAYDVATDAALGIQAVLENFLTSNLGVAAPGDEWDEGEAQFERSAEDDRFVTATLSRTELIYPQGAAGAPNNTASLVGMVYAIATDQEAASGFSTTPAETTILVRCTFSSGVRKGVTQDLDSLIYTEAIPAIKTRVALALRSKGTLYVVRNSLQANTSANQISGSVDLVAVVTGSILSAAKIYQDAKSTGVTYLDVLDGSDYGVDKHESNKRWFRAVRLILNEVGRFGAAAESYVSDQLATLIGQEITEQQSEGFELLNEEREASEVTRQIEGELALDVLRSTVVLRFRRVDVRNVESDSSAAQAQAASAGGVQSEDVEVAQDTINALNASAN